MYDDRESKKTVDPMTIISNIAIPMDSILTITYPIGIVYTACDDHDRRLPMTAYGINKQFHCLPQRERTGFQN